MHYQKNLMLKFSSSRFLFKFSSINIEYSDFHRYIDKVYRSISIDGSQKTEGFFSQIRTDRNKNELIYRITTFESSNSHQAKKLEVESFRRILYLLDFFDLNIQKKSDFLIHNLIYQLLNRSVHNFCEFYLKFKNTGHSLKCYNKDKKEIISNFISIFEIKQLFQNFSPDQSLIALDFFDDFFNENSSFLEKKKIISLSSQIYDEFSFFFTDKFDDTNLNFINNKHFLIEKKVFAILARTSKAFFMEKFKFLEEPPKNIIEYSKFLYKFCLISENSVAYSEGDIFYMVKILLKKNFGFKVLDMLCTSKEILNFGDLVSKYISKNILYIKQIDKIINLLDGEKNENSIKMNHKLKVTFDHIFSNLFRLDEKSLLFCISLEINDKLPFNKFISFLYYQYLSCKLKKTNDKNLSVISLLSELRTKISPKKLPVIFHILQPLLSEYITNEKNLSKLSRNLSRIISYKTMAYCDNLNLYLVLDKKLMALLKDQIAIPWDFEYFNFFMKAEHLFIENFYFLFQDSLFRNFSSMKFSNVAKNLYLINNQISTINLLPIISYHLSTYKTDAFASLLASLNLTSIYFITSNLLNYQFVDKIDLDLWSKILKMAIILLTKRNEFLNMDKSFLLNLLIIKCLYPQMKDVYPKEIEEMIKKNLCTEDYTYKNNRFHSGIKKLFLKCSPDLKFKENFTAVDNHFECDFYLEEKQILIEFLGPKHFNQDSEIILCSQRILDIKKKIYRRVVLINCFEWNDMSLNEQIQYIQNILNIN